MNLWSGNDRVQKFDSNGTAIAMWGTAGTGNGEFKSPMGIAVDSTGNVYVSDGANNNIQKITSHGTFITAWGSSGKDKGQFWEAVSIDIDSKTEHTPGKRMQRNKLIQIF
jgi:DNA-binding beta-propeller fold protein YncE